MAEAQDNKAAADKKADEKKPLATQETRRSAVNPEETHEERREAFDTTESEKVQDGRAVNLGEGLIPDPNFTPPVDDPDAEAPLIMDPDTGTLDDTSGAERAVFNQTRLKVVNGHTVLTDHLKGDEKLIDLQSDIADNETAADSQWRW